MNSLISFRSIWYYFSQSRNGTYINDKHIIGQKAELGHNDIISFGFNCLKLYNIRDKQAFIYRMIKEADLDTINVYDSDDDANDDDVVVVLDSDSTDGNDSDDERIRDIDDDVIISSDDDIYYDSDDDSIGSGDFVVTQRVKNLPQPVTVDLLADDDIEHTTTSPIEQKKTDATDDQVIKDQKPDDAASSTSKTALAEQNVEKDATSEVNGTAGGTNSTGGDANAAEGGTSESVTVADGDTATIAKVADTKEDPTKSIRSEMNARSGIRLISAQPLRKRRRTITEREYEDAKKQRQQKRLAQIAVDEKEKQTAATGTPNGDETESKRPVAVPKVKISQVSRAEMLATDMLADSSK